MESELTSLLKRKYGTTKSTPVVFTEKDTLYTCFRKLADNIYKNGVWTQEDEKRAVDTIIRNRNGFPLGEKEIHWTTSGEIQKQAEIIIEPLREVDRMYLGNRLDGKVGYMTLVNRTTSDDQKTTTKKTYVLLDPENKSGTKHGTFYYFAHREVNEFTYMAIGNMNRAIGYDKLQRDILKEFDSNEEPLSFEREHLESFLSKLSSAKYSGKKHASHFEKDLDGELTDEFLDTLPRDESKIGGFMKEAPYVLKDGRFTRYLYPENLKENRRKNQIIAFVQKYIQNTYDILLQSEYEKDIDKQTRASAWQTKKHINKETLEMMTTTSLINYFGYIEIDNDVDLKLFKQFEAEMERVHAILPKIGEKAPDLRLRKLGNHNALGLYVPSKHTIVVDFRDTGDAIGGVGIQSFVHEYGHFLDYDVNDGKLLSMSEAFKPIVTRYRENIRFKATNTYVSKKASYYGTPTEVFARAFEIYISEAGFRSPLLKTRDIYKTNMEYALFDKEMRGALTTYFDQQFPTLKTAITTLNKKEEKVDTKDVKAEVVEQQENDAEKQRVEELLKEEPTMEKINQKNAKEQVFENQQKVEDETLKAINQNVQNELATKHPNALERAISFLEKQHVLSTKNNQWTVAAAIKEQMDLLKLEVNVRDSHSLVPITEEISKLEKEIIEREKDSMYADSWEQSSQISTDIQRLKERKEMLNHIADKCISNYKIEALPQKESIVHEVTYVLEGFKKEVDETLKEIPKEEQANISKKEIEHLLDQHMKKVELLIGKYVNTINTIKESTNREIVTETVNMKKQLSDVLTNFKRSLQNYLTMKKERVMGRVTDSLDDIRLSIKNAMNYQILKVNDQLKNVVQKIDQSIFLEVKGVEPIERFEEIKTVEKEKQQQSQKKSMRKESIIDEQKEEMGKEAIVTVNEEEQALQYVNKIDQLSKQLGLDVTEKDKQSIRDLSIKEKEKLIQELETTLERREKTFISKETEIEVGEK
ncbi:LPD1 domain-containing protein [Enterococcus faecalis]|uniref:LPD1 domain-containing protein n=1 Tax=Enterococcus faecalis TaxID=1351 RepID=UPI001A9619D1|nr:LPD1 domain-containing protein [Enterococcus faecalis]MBO1137180.1 hypothetical protein [Enterococcus faecalis]